MGVTGGVEVSFVVPLPAATWAASVGVCPVVRVSSFGQHLSSDLFPALAGQEGGSLRISVSYSPPSLVQTMLSR